MVDFKIKFESLANSKTTITLKKSKNSDGIKKYNFCAVMFVFFSFALAGIKSKSDDLKGHYTTRLF